MKQNLIAAALMLASLTAYGADRAADGGQSTMQTSNNPDQTTKPSELLLQSEASSWSTP